MGTAAGNASASGSGKRTSPILDLTGETDSSSSNRPQPTLIVRGSTTITVRTATPFVPQDPTTKISRPSTSSTSNKASSSTSSKTTQSPYGAPFATGVGFHGENQSKKDSTKKKNGSGAGRIASSAFAGILPHEKIPRKQPGQSQRDPNEELRQANDKIVKDRMAAVDSQKEWQKNSGNFQYQPVVPAGRGTGTGSGAGRGRGGKQANSMRGKGGSNSNGANGGRQIQAKIHEYVTPAPHPTPYAPPPTPTNPNGIDIKGKGKEIIIDSSSGEEEEEVDEIEDVDVEDSRRPQVTRTSGLLQKPMAMTTSKRRTEELEEDGEKLSSREVPNRSIAGGRQGKVKEMAARIEQRTVPHLEVQGDPDASFDSIIPSGPTKAPSKPSKNQILTEIPMMYYRFGPNSLTTEFKSYTHSLVFNSSNSPTINLSRRGTDGTSESYQFKANEIVSIEPPADYEKFVTLEFKCKESCGEYKRMLNDHKIKLEENSGRSIRLYFCQPAGNNNVGQLEGIIDSLGNSKGKSGVIFGRIGAVGQQHLWSLFHEEFNSVTPTPTTSTSTLRRPNAALAVAFQPSKTAPVSKSGGITFPSKEEFTARTTPTTSFYGEAVHATRSAGKAADKRWEDMMKPSSAAVVPDSAFDAPVENAEEIALVWPRDVKGAFSITRGDLARLNEHQYLNDTLIELGLKRITNTIQAIKPELAESIHVFNSFFYQKLSAKTVKPDRRVSKGPAPLTSLSENYKMVRRWTQKVDLFSKKYIVVPINEHYHWYLAIIVNPAAVLREVVEPISDLGGTRAQTRHSLGGGSPSKSTIVTDSPVAGPSSLRTVIDGDGMGMEIDSEGIEEGKKEKERIIYSPPSAQRSIQPRKSIVGADLDSSSDEGDDVVAATLTPSKFPGTGKSMREVAESGAGVGGGEGGEEKEAAEVLNGLMGDTTMNDVAGAIVGPSNLITSLVSSPALSNDVCYIFTFDSLGSPHKPVINKLKDYLAEEANDKKGITKASVKSIVGKGVKVPQQPNTADCGFYLLHYTERFFTNNLGGPEEMTRYSIAKPKGKLEEQTREMNLNWDRPTVLFKRQAMREEMTRESIEWLEWREPFKKIEEEEAAAKRERRKAKLDAEGDETDYLRAVEASLLSGGVGMIASGSGSGNGNGNGTGGKGKRKSAEVEGGAISTEMKEGRSGSRKRSEGPEEDPPTEPKKTRKSTLKQTTTTKSVEEITIDDDDDPTSSPAKPSSRATSAKAALPSVKPPKTTTTEDQDPNSSLAAPMIDSMDVEPSTPPRPQSLPAPSVSHHAPMDLDEASPTTSTSTSVILPPHPLEAPPPSQRSHSSPPVATNEHDAPIRSKHFSPAAANSKRSILHPNPPPPCSIQVAQLNREPVHPLDAQSLAAVLFPPSPVKPSSKSTLNLVRDSQESASSEEEPASRRAPKKQKIDDVVEAAQLGIRGVANGGFTSNGNEVGRGGGSSAQKVLDDLTGAAKNGRSMGMNRFGGISINGQASKLAPKVKEFSIKGGSDVGGTVGGAGRGEEESQDDDVQILEPSTDSDSALEKRDREEVVEEEVLQDGQGRPGRSRRK